MPEGEIVRERQSLEDAIRRISAEYPASPPASDAATIAPKAPSVAEAPTTRPAAAPPAPAKAAASEPAAPSEAVVSSAAKAPSAAPEAPSAPAHAQDAAPSPDQADEASAPPSAAEDEKTLTDRRPVLGRAPVAAKTTARPRLPADNRASGSPRWTRTLLITLLVAVVVAGGVFAAVERERLFGLVSGSPAPAAVTQAPAPEPAKPAEQSKSNDRIAQASGDASKRAAPPPMRPANAAAQRAVLFEESAGASQGLQSYEGTVTWKTETYNAGPGLPPEIGIRGDIQIPERRISISFTLRRNLDQALPASHTIEIGFGLPQDFAYGGISNVPGIRMKQTESAQGAPLAGLSVRVNPTYFLVGLSAVPADKQRNVQLLQTRPWIDVPVVYTNNKRGIIAFEKGPTGEQAFQDAFAAWGELISTTPPPMSPVPDGQPAR
ncbi:hypothetical protein J5J86_07780 [Aquabacter sp. L1I39]|uniref:hypothetical protein n=1 Tax=Aquabacter sp. L1I39 TaxID=2820278 RepID=UPI001ADA059C|nr:hypothetical protein [Aquabacter sp. L1I39]QTL05179.1 hypothetical protein J5J86_07780 [Aquabacter sp. L1I39]